MQAFMENIKSATGCAIPIGLFHIAFATNQMILYVDVLLMIYSTDKQINVVVCS